MKTIIAGSRSISWCGALAFALQSCPWKVTRVVSGRARGPDTFGELFALQAGLPLDLYPADWQSNGKRAGLIRNARMAMDSEALVVLWDGESRGTAHMIACMAEDNKPIHKVIIPAWL